MSTAHGTHSAGVKLEGLIPRLCMWSAITSYLQYFYLWITMATGDISAQCLYQYSTRISYGIHVLCDMVPFHVEGHMYLHKTR